MQRSSYIPFTGTSYLLTFYVPCFTGSDHTGNDISDYILFVHFMPVRFRYTRYVYYSVDRYELYETETIVYIL
jgi:hypothetical protein